MVRSPCEEALFPLEQADIGFRLKERAKIDSPVGPIGRDTFEWLMIEVVIALVA